MANNTHNKKAPCIVPDILPMTTVPHFVQGGLHMGFGNANTDIITQSLQHIAKLIYTYHKAT